MFRYGRRSRRYRRRYIRRRPRTGSKYSYRRSYGRKRAAVSSAIAPVVADRMMVKMKYSTRVQMISASGVDDFHFFRGNGIYDPDLTGIGEQPLSFDQWSGFYTNYRCYGSKIVIRPVPSVNNVTFELVAVPTTLASGYDDIDTASEAPFAIHKLVTNTTPTTVKNYMSSSKIFGVNKTAVKTSTSFVGTMGVGGADPPDSWFWQLTSAPADRASSQTLICFVTITYYVELFNRVELDGS